MVVPSEKDIYSYYQPNSNQLYSIALYYIFVYLEQELLKRLRLRQLNYG